MAPMWIYIIELANGNLYTGWSNDLERRLEQHKGLKKGGAKATRASRPVRLCMSWQIEGEKGDAMRVEAFIKKYPRAQKLNYIKKPEMLEKDFNLKNGEKPVSISPSIGTKVL